VDSEKYRVYFSLKTPFGLDPVGGGLFQAALGHKEIGN
jgi:hypothetical protein